MIITRSSQFQFEEEGTSQHSLLRNRIKALYISEALLSDAKAAIYTRKDLREVLPPIVSIINKTTKAQIALRYKNLGAIILYKSKN